MIRKSGVSYCPTREGLVKLLGEEMHHGYFAPQRDKVAEEMVSLGEFIVEILNEEGFTTPTLYKNQKNNFGLMMYPWGGNVEYKLTCLPYVFDLGVPDMFKLYNTSMKQVFSPSFQVHLQLLPIFNNLAIGSTAPYSLMNIGEKEDPIEYLSFGNNSDLASELVNLGKESLLLFDFPTTTEDELMEMMNSRIPHWEGMKQLCLYLYEQNFEREKRDPRD